MMLKILYVHIKQNKKFVYLYNLNACIYIINNELKN